VDEEWLSWRKIVPISSRRCYIAKA
jgi:hypothetical protein